LTTILMLAACQPQDPDGKAASPPVDARAQTTGVAPKPASGGMDISQPIIARGTEPFWAVTVADGKTLTLKRPGEADVVFQAGGAAVQPGRATWIAAGPAGRQMTLTLYVSACSDGMSDLAYPWTAELVMPGEVLNGCAGKTAELPREGAG
jgi:uncharacterized membrane protein